jgi:hypothetical protein
MTSHHFAAWAVVAAAAAWSATARADDTTAVVAIAPPPALVAEIEGYTGPNRVLVTTGLVTFAAAYAPAIVVATDSARQGDEHLYVPVAGPWLDLADRRAGCRSIGCGAETTNRLLLVASGTVQGVGALLALASFVFPERLGYLVSEGAHARQTARGTPNVHVRPAQLGAAAYGVAAFGDF